MPEDNFMKCVIIDNFLSCKFLNFSLILRNRKLVVHFTNKKCLEKNYTDIPYKKLVLSLTLALID